MNKLNLLSKLVIAGAVTATGITLLAPQKAEAGTVYGFSKLEFEGSILLNGNPIFLDAESDTRATLLPPGGTETGFDPFNEDGFSDAPQSYVNNAGLQNSTIVPENTFNPRQGSFVGNPPVTISGPGPIGPDFARADSYACDLNNIAGETCLDFGLLDENTFVAANVAEVYIKGDSGVLESGLGVGDWDLVSETFTAEEGDELEVEIDYVFELIAGITGFDPGEFKAVESTVEWDFIVRDVTNNAIVEQISFADIEALLNDNHTLEADINHPDVDPVPPVAFSLTVAAGDLIVGNEYNK